MKETSLLIIVSAISGVLILVVKACYKSKCSRIKFCCLTVERNTNEETELEEDPSDKSPEALPRV